MHGGLALKELREIAKEQLRVHRRIDELIGVADDHFDGREHEALALALELVDLVRHSMALAQDVIVTRENAAQLLEAPCPGGPH